jgi:hypothetical protein
MYGVVITSYTARRCDTCRILKHCRSCLVRLSVLEGDAYQRWMPYSNCSCATDIGIRSEIVRWALAILQQCNQTDIVPLVADEMTRGFRRLTLDKRDVCLIRNNQKVDIQIWRYIVSSSLQPPTCFTICISQDVLSSIPSKNTSL